MGRLSVNLGGWSEGGLLTRGTSRRAQPPVRGQVSPGRVGCRGSRSYGPRGTAHGCCSRPEPLPLSGPEAASPGDRGWLGWLWGFGLSHRRWGVAAHPRGEGARRGGGPGLRQGRKDGEAVLGAVSALGERHGKGRGKEDRGQLAPTPPRPPTRLPRETWVLRRSGGGGGLGLRTPGPSTAPGPCSLPGPSRPRRTQAQPLQSAPAAQALGPSLLANRRTPEPHSVPEQAPPALLPSLLAGAAVSSLIT